jgi:hypothetical protein
MAVRLRQWSGAMASASGAAKGKTSKFEGVPEDEPVTLDGVRWQKAGKNGNRMPVGRPRGALGRVPTGIKEAVLATTARGACHKEGLTGYLIGLARSKLVADRQMYISLVGRCLPQEPTAGGGGIIVQLNWLNGRQVGTTTSQSEIVDAQVHELIDNIATAYGIADPQPAQLPEPDAISRPPPPLASGAGGPAGSGTPPTFSLPPKCLSEAF